MSAPIFLLTSFLWTLLQPSSLCLHLYISLSLFAFLISFCTKFWRQFEAGKNGPGLKMSKNIFFCISLRFVSSPFLKMYNEVTRSNTSTEIYSFGYSLIWIDIVIISNCKINPKSYKLKPKVWRFKLQSHKFIISKILKLKAHLEFPNNRLGKRSPKLR